MYIFLIGGGRGCCGWLKRGKEKENARNTSLYAFHFSHDIYMPIKWEIRKGLLLNKNQA